MGTGGPGLPTPVPAYEWGEEWRNKRVYTHGQTVVSTFKGREYLYICQVEYSYGTRPLPYIGTVLSFPNEQDPEDPDWNGSRSWVTKTEWGDWKPIVPEWKEGEVYRHGHSVMMNGHIYVASLRYEYLVPPENRGTEQNPDYYYMRDERQEEQGPLLDVDREGIRTWHLIAISIKKNRTYVDPQDSVFGFKEDENYRTPVQGTDAGGFMPSAETEPDAVIIHPNVNPEAPTEHQTMDAGPSAYYINGSSVAFFQHILLKVKDKNAPNGQYFAKDTNNPQSVSPDALPGWNTPPMDGRKLVNWWYGTDGERVFAKLSQYYTAGGEPDDYRNGVDSNWDGDWYYKDIGVLPADKCAVGFQSKYTGPAWPYVEYVGFAGDEETGEGIWYYQKQNDPGRPNTFFIRGEAMFENRNRVYPRDPADLPLGSQDNGLGNNPSVIGCAYGLVVNDKIKPKRPDGSDYYDYDENGNPTSWTDEDGNVNTGQPDEDENGNTIWRYYNENGDEVGKPTNDNGEEVDAFTDNWLRVTEGEGRGVFPPRLIGVCYTRKEDPNNIYAPIWKPCIVRPKNEDGSDVYNYNSDGNVTGWTDADGNNYSVVENGDGTFTGYDSNGDEVDLPGGSPYGNPDDYREYTDEQPAQPPDNEPWKRELYFYFMYNHGVFGDRTVNVEIEVTTILHTYNARELKFFDAQRPVLYSDTPLPPYVYKWKWIRWTEIGPTVELGYCNTGGFRAGYWKKVPINSSYPPYGPMPFDPYYPNYGYVWEYPPPSDCVPYEVYTETKHTIKKTFKVTHDQYATLNRFENFVGFEFLNQNKASDGSPNPGTGFCIFPVDIHSYGKDNTEYTWRLSKVEFPEGV